MKKLTILGFIAVLSLSSLTACGQGASAIKDGVCSQGPSNGLPVPLDPDCGSTPAK